MAHPRLVISLCALCLCACAGGSPAYGSYAPQAGHKPRAAHGAGKAHRAARCARKSSSRRAGHGHRSTVKARSSSFHANKRHRLGGGPSCGKHRDAGHHTARPAPKASPTSPPVDQSTGYGQTPLPPPGSEGACPGSSLSPNSRNLELIRGAVLCLVNRERVAHGESPLERNALLQQAAEAHTESMVSENYLEHIGPQGDTPLTRMREAGYIYSSHIGFEVGENIGWGTYTKSTPAAIVAAWMASPGHRANILDARFRDSAVGVSPHPPTVLAHNQPGGIYTQDFGVITAG